MVSNNGGQNVIHGLVRYFDDYTKLKKGESRQVKGNQNILNFSRNTIDSFMVDIKKEIPGFKDLEINLIDASITKVDSETLDISNFEYEILGSFISSWMIPEQKIMIQRINNAFYIRINPNYMMNNLFNKIVNFYELNDYTFPKKLELELTKSEDLLSIKTDFLAFQCDTQSQFENTMDKIMGAFSAALYTDQEEK